TYAVTALAAGWEPTELNVSVAGAPIPALVVTLFPAILTVQGTVVNASSGVPIANASVIVTLPSSHLRVNTSASGDFALELPLGTYPVRVTDLLYRSVNRTLTVTPGDLFVTFSLTPVPAFSVYGKVTSSDGGAAVGNATIILNFANGSLDVPVRNGTFSLDLPNGTYQMEVLANGFPPEFVEVTVTGTPPGPINVVLSTASSSPLERNDSLAVLLPGLLAGAGATLAMWLALTRGPRGRPPRSRHAHPDSDP
ncbi:MAG: carboxypeptidase regulatory-like domain-containing protein, partial [Thermoplasmata archaeon]